MLKIGAVEKKRQTNNMNVDFPYAQYLSDFLKHLLDYVETKRK